jgi:hypothetical protein
MDLRAADAALTDLLRTGLRRTALGRIARGSGREPGRGHGRTDAKCFLRGVQISEAKGLVQFATVYPGWYVAHTGEFFFPRNLTERIAKPEPCAKRLNIDRTRQAADMVFSGQHGSEQMQSDSDGLRDTVTVAVDWEAGPAPVGAGGRGPR